MSRPRAAALAKLPRAAPIFAALGDETRLTIVARLCARGPQSIIRLTEGANMSRQAITKHLHALARAGVIRGTRQGRERIWTVRTERLAEVGQYLEQISTQWDAALERLRAAVESEEG